MNSNNERWVIVNKEGYFDEFVKGISSYLTGLGIRIEFSSTLAGIKNADTVLVIGIHGYPLGPFGFHARLLGVQTEQLGENSGERSRLGINTRRFNSIKRYYDLIFEWTPSNFSRGLGGKVFIPYGCEPRPAVDRVEEFDLCFIGNIGGSQRRQAMLSFLSARYRLYPDFSPGFEERKRAAIASSSICLNIHYYDDKCFESPRMFDLLSQGAFVISETSYSSEPFMPGRDFETFSSPEELESKINYFLESPDARSEVARAGHAAATKHTFARTAEMIFDAASRVKRSRFQKAFGWSIALVSSSMLVARDRFSLLRRRLRG